MTTHRDGSEKSSFAYGLIQAARDIRRDVLVEIRLNSANISYIELFERYVEELEYAKKWAETWWASVEETEASRTIDAVVRKQVLTTRLPIGAAAHGGHIAVIRNFWLACCVLNDKNPLHENVAPEQLLLAWLIQDGREELARFVAQLPYWPIGMDEEGKWV